MYFLNILYRLNSHTCVYIVLTGSLLIDSWNVSVLKWKAYSLKLTAETKISNFYSLT